LFKDAFLVKKGLITCSRIEPYYEKSVFIWMKEFLKYFSTSPDRHFS